ncbi:MAG: hypothetical protein C0504_08340 [Candidatus Solibacter sp.]|nr:hypothetical protein [Candidatus Solibacter sp.]
MVSEPGQSRKTVSSWKEIAAHFGVTVRTTQIWEAERGLPVHRMPGVKGRVYAYIDELEGWAKGELSHAAESLTEPSAAAPARSPRKPWLLVSLAAFGVVAAAVAALSFVNRPHPVPSAYEISGRTLVVSNPAGEVIWRHEFAKQIVPMWETGGAWTPFVETRPWIGDIDGDGTREVLFTYSSDPKGLIDSEVYCFDSGGNVRWRYRPGRPVETRKEQFPMPFLVRMVIAMDRPAGKPPILLVVAAHSVFYPSQIVALSPQGKVLREYWHSGHIAFVSAADLDRDSKPELYLLACHNATRTASLIALDPEDFGGASRESNPDYQLLNLGPPRELGRVILPASELNRQLGDPLQPSGLSPQSGRIFVGAEHTLNRPDLDYKPGVFHQFGPRLEPLGVEYAWNFKGIYDQLVRTGRIKPYDLDADLEKMKQAVAVTPWRGGNPAR